VGLWAWHLPGQLVKCHAIYKCRHEIELKQTWYVYLTERKHLIANTASNQHNIITRINFIEPFNAGKQNQLLQSTADTRGLCATSVKINK